MNLEASCRLCGAESRKEDSGVKQNDYTIFECSVCRSAFVDLRPEQAEIEQLYNELFAAGGYAQHRIEHEAIRSGTYRGGKHRRMLLRRMGKKLEGRKLVEIGSGTGAFGYDAQRLGWDYRGIDVSESAAEFARQLGLDVRVMDADTLPPLDPRSADLVVMWEVIEHIWDVQGYLRVIKESLRPGGHFLCSTPNWPSYRREGEWGPLSRPPVHLNFFTASSLDTAFRNAGFGDSSVTHRRVYLPAPTVRSVLHSVRVATGLTKPETLIGIASAPPVAEPVD